MAVTNWSQTDLDTLENAIAQGVRSVKYTDKEIVYRSLEDMLRVRDLIRSKLGLDKTPRGVRRVAQINKAL